MIETPRDGVASCEQCRQKDVRQKDVRFGIAAALFFCRPSFCRLNEFAELKTKTTELLALDSRIFPSGTVVTRVPQADGRFDDDRDPRRNQSIVSIEIHPPRASLPIWLRA